MLNKLVKNWKKWDWFLWHKKFNYRTKLVEGNKIYWSKIKQIKVTYTNPYSLYYKYEYDEDFSEIITASTSTINTRKRKSTANATTSSVPMWSWNQPIPVQFQFWKLCTKICSLCRMNAIPQNYHSFYNSLMSENEWVSH